VNSYMHLRQCHNVHRVFAVGAQKNKRTDHCEQDAGLKGGVTLSWRQRGPVDEH
jgi:hypothetical protein